MAEHLGDLSSNLETRSQQPESLSPMKIGQCFTQCRGGKISATAKKSRKKSWTRRYCTFCGAMNRWLLTGDSWTCSDSLSLHRKVGCVFE